MFFANPCLQTSLPTGSLTIFSDPVGKLSRIFANQRWQTFANVGQPTRNKNCQKKCHRTPKIAKNCVKRVTTCSRNFANPAKIAAGFANFGKPGLQTRSFPTLANSLQTRAHGCGFANLDKFPPTCHLQTSWQTRFASWPIEFANFLGNVKPWIKRLKRLLFSVDSAFAHQEILEGDWSRN